MNVLVAYASRAGSTAEIAESVGKTLRAAGLEVTVCACADISAVGEYDAVVLGSAVYVGRWEHDAIAFLQRWGDQLPPGLTWLFQSGPCGPDADEQPCETPRKVTRLIQRFGLGEPVTFGGRLDPAAAKDWLSRQVAKGANAGDFRDWDAITGWAQRCAGAITGTPPRGMSVELEAALQRETSEPR